MKQPTSLRASIASSLAKKESNTEEEVKRIDEIPEKKEELQVEAIEKEVARAF